ncbi:F0F1 ATP synthase subunit epsilon [Rhabdothermincola salaria]|uniref:F0F1 ATP synthase subunit epsilon n=1 Tax=Rhabdothermincola salaria TaxID=2903142 RepID=UPI001E540276|nr:F0F1 ATP synthase subunit epsilon [Rhabdothermincola salaria]MCD9625044.1 F0F1 ATP synthase subunit epsilon [Rhabdothermincola salaria]
MPLHVELVSPERTLFAGDATMVRARTVGGGDIAFLPGHAPFVGALATWTLEIALVDGGTELAAVHGGFIEVSNDQVKILSNLAEMASAIDADRARQAKERHEAAVAKGEDVEAEAGLRRAHARLVATGQTVG